MNEYFLADDLSGALEVAAAFYQAGRKSIVIWSEDGWAACGPDDVIGFDTETRNSAPTVAAAGVTKALQEAGARGRKLLFKKIDSTMRGPVAAELAAVAAALPGTTVLFTPANPHAGRTVRDGVLLVQGVPVAQTDFGRDPVMPVKESSILGAVPAGTAGRVIPLDVATDADFVRAIEQRERAGGPWMAVGSGALARVLVPRLVRPDSSRSAASAALPASPGGVLLVGGSAHPLNRTQAARLTAQHQVPVHEINPAVPDLAATDAISSLRTSGAASLLVVPRGTGASFDSAQVLRSVTAVATRVVQETGVRRLMVTGGETAKALCDAWGIRALRVLGDVEPGLVLAASEGTAERWLMAIKPGGFGGDATWIKAAEALRSAR